MYTANSENENNDHNEKIRYSTHKSKISRSLRLLLEQKKILYVRFKVELKSNGLFINCEKGNEFSSIQ